MELKEKSEMIGNLVEQVIGELDAYDGYMKGAEKFSEEPRLVELYTHIAQEEHHHFEELHKLMGELMAEVSEEIHGPNSKNRNRRG